RFLVAQVSLAIFTVQDALFGAAATLAAFFINIGAQIAAAISQLTGQWDGIQNFLSASLAPALDAIQDAGEAVFDAILPVFCVFSEFCRVLPFCSRPSPCFDSC